MFADQPTVRQAREWRARLLSNSDPIKAAEELLDLRRNWDIHDHATNEAANHLNLLNLAGDLLLEAVAVHALDGIQSSAEKVGRWKTLTGKFSAESAECIRSNRGMVSTRLRCFTLSSLA